MGGFNPDDYVDVATRLAMFWQAHPDGRIDTRLDPGHGLDNRVVFAAAAYAHRDDPVPSATGWASERLDVSGRSAEATNPVEVCETSAVGRALANWVFQASARRPSREEMEAANRRREGEAAEPSEEDVAEAAAVIDGLRDRDPSWWEAEVAPKRDDLARYAALSQQHMEATLSRLERSLAENGEEVPF